MDDPVSILSDRLRLLDCIQKRLGNLGIHEELVDLPVSRLKKASVVLFLLSQCTDNLNNGRNAPCLILNKRSAQVRQGGDLCFAGGGLSWPADLLWGRLLNLPGTTLRRWSRRQRRNASNGSLAMLLAAGLREAWEEMRLIPLRFRFLGVLPEQHLVMFDRVIYPMVGWVPPQRLKPNWEVERIVPIPLKKLLDPTHYGRFRPLVRSGGDGETQPLRLDDFPCFIHQDDVGPEMLWGATYRITESFLQLVFGFHPPQIDQLPLAHRHLDETYLNGSRWRSPAAQRSGNTDW